MASQFQDILRGKTVQDFIPGDFHNKTVEIRHTYMIAKIERGFRLESFRMRRIAQVISSSIQV